MRSGECKSKFGGDGRGAQTPESLTGRVIGAKYLLSSVAASVAESVTYPLDVTKTRLQIASYSGPSVRSAKSRSMFSVTWHILKDEGVRGLFSGLSPAVYRQIVYTGCRMSIYEGLRATVIDEEEKHFSIWKSTLFGMISGSVAQFISSPTDLVKVQMQTDGLRKLQNLPPKFESTSHVFKVLYRRNGFFGLWTGWLPNTQRAALLNMADLATYDETKRYLLANGYTDNWVTHLIGSGLSGIASAIVSTPADVVKTRIMDQFRHHDSETSFRRYNGSYDCLKRICQEEGFFALYKGLVPAYIRSAPWSVTFWLTYEQIRHLIGLSGF